MKGEDTEATVRQLCTLSLPGAMVGATTGVFAGVLGALASHPLSWVAVSMLALAVPMAMLGAGYSLMLVLGRFRPGVFAPAAGYWLVGFPLARLVHESSMRLALTGKAGVSEGIPAFLVFQALVSVGFAIGFLWAHERIMPRWLLRVRAGNPSADQLLTQYLQLASHVGKRR